MHQRFCVFTRKCCVNDNLSEYFLINLFNGDEKQPKNNVFEYFGFRPSTDIFFQSLTKVANINILSPCVVYTAHVVENICLSRHPADVAGGWKPAGNSSAVESLSNRCRQIVL